MWLLRPLLLLALIGISAMTPADGATRGIVVNLRANEKADAPISESVSLYNASHALVVGIDDYNNGWPKLSNAVKDAKLISAALEERGFDVEMHANLDSEELNSVFKKFFILKGNDPDARLFVWFAGHGATLGGEGYLVPADAPTPIKSEAEFKFASVALRDFGTFMRQAISKHVYAVFDSCFAGTVFSSQRAMPPAAITRATTQPVRQFLTSGDEDQQVSDDGTFRDLFLRAINGDERSDLNGDGYVTGSELGMFLNDRVTNLTQQLQTPRYGKLRDRNFDRGDFVFVLPETATGTAALNEQAASPGSNVSAEIAFWNSIKNSESAEQFDAYLKQYPNGNFATLALVRKNDLLARARRRESMPTELVDVRRLDRDFEVARTANVRANPYANATRVGQLDKGTSVWVTGEADTNGGKWYKVSHEGVELGFIYAPLLREVTGSDTRVAVAPLELPAPDEATGEPEKQVQVAAAETATTDSEQLGGADRRLSLYVDDLISSVSKAAESAEPATSASDMRGAATSARVTASATTTASSPASGAATAPAVQPRTTTTEIPALDDVLKEVMLASGEGEATSTPGTSAPGGSDTSEPAAEVTATPAPLMPAQSETGMETVAVGSETETTPAPLMPAQSETGMEAVAVGSQTETMPEPSLPAQSETGMETVAVGSEKETTAQAPRPAGTQLALAPVETADPEIQPYIDAAEAGNVRAQTALAYMYETGQRVAADKLRAAYWYRQAAEKGDVQAQLNLALMYENGNGVERDLVEAANWYRKAAVAGDPDAQQTLGYFYETGRGFAKDTKEAAWWYTRAAEQGRVAAQNNLGRLYQLGIGVAADREKAISWYRKAAEQGSEAARHNLEELTNR